MARMTFLISVLLILINCSSSSSDNNNTETYPIGGILSGLGTGLTVTLQNNGADDLLLSDNASFTFSTEVIDNEFYTVSISSQPNGQQCSVTNASGTVSGSVITNINVTCTDITGPTFEVSGNLTGLAGGESITLQNNSSEDLTLDSDGGFTFLTELNDNSTYLVTVSGQPNGQQCNVTFGSGTINSADIDNVSISCVAQSNSASLDTDFNPTGTTPGIYVRSRPPTTEDGFDEATDIAIDSLGRLLVSGIYWVLGNSDDDALVLRLNTDGTLDTTFDGDGLVLLHNVAGGDDNDQGHTITIDTMDRIILGGASKGATFFDAVIWRLDNNGTLDTSFSGDGMISFTSIAGGGLNNYIYDVTVDSSNNIYATGTSHNGADNDMFVIKLTSTGILDTSFNGNGVVIQNDAGNYTFSPKHDDASALTLDSSDRILVTGRSNTDDGAAMIIWRFNTDGSLDTTFNAAGATPGIVVYQATSSGTSFAEGQAILIDSMGRILVGGWRTPASANEVAIWRYLQDGTLDTTFAAGGFTPGVASFQISATTNVNLGFDIAIDSSDNIIMTGFTDNTTTSNDMFLLRVLSTGELDTSFNPTGSKPGTIQYHDAGGGDLSDQGKGIAIDSSGRIVVAGNSSNNNSRSDVVVWRVNP